MICSLNIPELQVIFIVLLLVFLLVYVITCFNIVCIFILIYLIYCGPYKREALIRGRNDK